MQFLNALEVAAPLKQTVYFSAEVSRETPVPSTPSQVTSPPAPHQAYHTSQSAPTAVTSGVPHSMPPQQPQATGVPHAKPQQPPPPSTPSHYPQQYVPPTQQHYNPPSASHGAPVSTSNSTVPSAVPPAATTGYPHYQQQPMPTPVPGYPQMYSQGNSYTLHSYIISFCFCKISFDKWIFLDVLWMPT